MTPYAEALDKLEALYALLPPLVCQGRCAASCGPVAVSHLERIRLQRQMGKTLQGATVYACPLLRRERCTAYTKRPLICRLWGVAETMQCAWGCMPERFLTATEVEAFLHAVEEVSQAIYPQHGTESFHTAAAIVQAQDQAAAQLCQVLEGRA